MRRIYLASFLSVFILLFVFAVGAQESNPSSADQRIPERSGVYNDPGHPGVKVRVFVHPERPIKTESSSLVCSLADPDSAAVVPSTGWRLSSNWIYSLNPSSVPSSVGSTNIASIANIAFSNWSSASNSKVNFSRGSDTSVVRSAYDGKNIVAWGRTNGSALGVTYTRYYASTGQVVDVDTIMNKKFLWRWSGGSATCAYSDAYDAQNILTHELGHWVGLDDTYDGPYKDNTMYGYGSKGESKKDTLTTGDKAGTFAIYNP